MIATHPYRLGLILCVLLLSATPLRAKELVVAYVPNWVNLTSFSETIDYARITHINIAFENPTNDAGDLSFNKMDDVLIAKAHANGVKVLVSIGGGAASGNKTLKARYFDLLTEAKRADFVKRLSAYVSDHGFDGLDVDIEGPSINGDYGAFIRDLSAALKPRGKLLTSASPRVTAARTSPTRCSSTSTSSTSWPTTAKAPGHRIHRVSTRRWTSRSGTSTTG